MTETASGAEYISEAHVRHIMRYVQARDWLADRPRGILDAACGTGYGSNLLAKAGHQVTGFDFDDDALAEAVKYKSCHFEKHNLINSDLDKGRGFGAIICIETIEHFSEIDGYHILKKFHEWLLNAGTLIISTPYCTHSGPSPITKQHLWEYSLTDFERALVQAGFSVELIKTERHEGQAGRLGYAMAKAIKR